MWPGCTAFGRLFKRLVSVIHFSAYPSTLFPSSRALESTGREESMFCGLHMCISWPQMRLRWGWKGLRPWVAIPWVTCHMWLAPLKVFQRASLSFLCTTNISHSTSRCWHCGWPPKVDLLFLVSRLLATLVGHPILVWVFFCLQAVWPCQQLLRWAETSTPKDVIVWGFSLCLADCGGAQAVPNSLSLFFTADLGSLIFLFHWPVVLTWLTSSVYVSFSPLSAHLY